MGVVVVRVNALYANVIATKRERLKRLLLFGKGECLMMKENRRGGCLEVRKEIFRHAKSRGCCIEKRKKESSSNEIRG